MKRSLSLKKDVLAELSADDLAAVDGGAASILGGCVDLSFRADCGGIPTCNYMCTNTSTIFKG